MNFLSFRRTMVIAAASAMLIVPAFAQSTSPGMPGMSAATPADASPSSQAFKAGDAKMMKAMNVPLSGDADQDFVAGMIPHHQGAIDMAKVELRYGKNPEMRRLARNIIKAQDKEIAAMRAWQAKHPQH